MEYANFPKHRGIAIIVMTNASVKAVKICAVMLCLAAGDCVEVER